MNFGEIERKMICIQRLFSLEDVPQEATDHDAKFDGKKWPSSGQIEFVNASLRYRPTTEIVLKNLSFVVSPGTKVGVVGRTGAGKSTICLSISRIVELCGGRIEIDGIDIRKVDLQQLRRKVTVISQDPTLFKGSLRFNLDPFRRVSDQAIESLLVKAGLQDLLNREVKEAEDATVESSMGEYEENHESVATGERENQQMLRNPSSASKSRKVRGIYFKVAENGSNLSAGEKQLICICRAILRKNKVVVLDEATANIDIVTEKKI